MTTGQSETPADAEAHVAAEPHVAAVAAPTASLDDAEALREEIERTRVRLGQTVQALAAKADVKARAQDKAAQLTGQLKTTATQATQRAAATARRRRVPLAAVIGSAAMAWLVIRRWRSR
jgi:hypothetical protein